MDEVKKDEQGQIVTESEAPKTPELVEVGEGQKLPVEELKKSYFEARKGFNKKAEELALMKKKYQWADNFQKELENNPNLRRHIEDFYSGGGTKEEFEENFSSSSVPHGRAPDPMQAKMESIEAKLYSYEIDKAFNELGKSVDVSDEQKAAILEKAGETGDYDVQGLYWKMFGLKALLDAKQKAEKEITEKVKKSSVPYVPVAGGSVPEVTEPSKMDDAQWEKELLGEISKRLNSE